MSRYSLQTGNLITKSQLSLQLTVAYTTIHKYHAIALILPEFKGDYPVLDGEHYTRMAMTIYQCWVITKIIREFSNYPEKIVYQLVNDNQEQFSKKAFLEQQATSVVDGQLVKI